MLAKTVLNHWGLRTTEDFGKIVFALVEAGLMRKTDEDTLEDFQGVYDFDEEFAETFEDSIGARTEPVSPTPGPAISDTLSRQATRAPGPTPRVTWRDLHLWQIQPVRDVLLIVAVVGLFWLGDKISLVWCRCFWRSCSRTCSSR